MTVTKEAVVSQVAVHDTAPGDVQLRKLSAAYCLSIGPVDIYGTARELREVISRAHDLIEQAS